MTGFVSTANSGDLLDGALPQAIIRRGGWVLAALIWAMAGNAMAQAAPGQAPVIASAPVVATTAPGGSSLASADMDYQLGVADKVRIIVFNEPTLSGEFVVNANGSLSFPLIGDVPASGLTPGQVARAIADRLKEGYVLSPSVSIDMLTFRPFYILGEVNKPGEYPYSNGLTVDAAVAMAQGYTYRADKRKVFLRHKGEAQASKQELTPDLRVAPGDTIRISERHW